MANANVIPFGRPTWERLNHDSMMRAHRALREIRSARRHAPLSNAPVSLFRSYNAAKVNRLTNDWTTVNLSADATTRYALRTLRARSRDLAENDDYARKFLHMVRTNVIGPAGIRLQSQAREPNNGPLDKAANDRIEDAWRRWGRHGSCDVTGRLSWTDAQSLFIASVLRDGEVLIRKVRGYDNPFAFALQFIEADHLDEDYNIEVWLNGNEIRMSVEFDRWRRPVAYHVLVKHPGDYTYVSKTGQLRERIPASEIIHAYITERAGQSRGVPWMISAMTRLRNIGAYEEAAIIQARVDASKMGIIQSPTGTEYQGESKDAGGNIIHEVEPGLVTQLPAGWEWKQHDPTHPSGEFGPFMKAALRGIASGFNVSYNTLASDPEGVTYATLRSMLLEDRDAWRIMQTWTAEMLCDAVYPEWLSMALLTQELALPVSKIAKWNAPRWRPRGWTWVDPENEMAANISGIRAGVNSQVRVLGEQGLELEDVFAELAEAQKLAEQYGITLDLSSTGTPPPQPDAPGAEPRTATKKEVPMKNNGRFQRDANPAVRGKTFHREISIDRQAIDEEGRTIELSFSSETPIQDWPGIMLILDHSPGCVRLDRIQQMGALLVDHNRTDVVGAIEKAFIGSDRKGRAVARFGRSARAEEVWQDCKDKIRRGISVNFQVHHAVLEETGDETVETYRADDWEPLEISLVSVPADPSVGVGRGVEPPISQKSTPQINTQVYGTVVDQEKFAQAVLNSIRNTQHSTLSRSKEVPIMKFCAICGKELIDGACPAGCSAAAPAPARSTPADPPPSVKIEVIQRQVMERVSTILALGEQHNCAELARAAIAAGKSVDDFRDEILRTVYKDRVKPIDTVDPRIGMNNRETRGWSIVRAINALVERNWSAAGLELEASQAVASRLHKNPQGFWIPYDVLERSIQDTQRMSERETYNIWQRMLNVMLQRDLTTGTWNAGGALVATELLSASFIELLRNKMMVRALGATMLGGLIGDIAIPKQTGAATAYWITEGNSPTESQQTLGQVGLTPHTVGAYTDISRKLLLQSSIDVEAFVRSDLAAILAIAQDLAAINGSGVDGQPRGILQHPDITTDAVGTNGGYASWGNIVSLETGVANANADVGTMAYLTNAKLRGQLKQTAKVTSQAIYIWENTQTPGQGMMNGYRAEVSNQVPADLVKGSGSSLCALIFGVWNQLVIGEWGGVDVLIDPYTGGTSGAVRVRVLMDTDIALRHGQSFAVIKDAKF